MESCLCETYRRGCVAVLCVSYVNSTVVREKDLLDVQCHMGTAEVQVLWWYILKSDYMTL